MTGPAATRSRGDQVARLATEVFAPAVLIALLLIVVGWHAGDQAGVSRWWGLPSAVFAAGIPLAYILRGVRRGRYADHHIPEREQRLVPLLVGLACVLLGTAILAAVGAPRDLLALLMAGAVGLAAFAAVTHLWKMSIHAGVIAGTVTVLTCVYGVPALITLPLVPLICWARLRLSAHTRAQVVAGSVVGALIAGTVFSALR